MWDCTYYSTYTWRVTQYVPTYLFCRSVVYFNNIGKYILLYRFITVRIPTWKNFLHSMLKGILGCPRSNHTSWRKMNTRMSSNQWRHYRITDQTLHIAANDIIYKSRNVVLFTQKCLINNCTKQRKHPFCTFYI